MVKLYNIIPATLAAVLLLMCIAGAIYGIETKNTGGTVNCVFFGIMAYSFVHVLRKERKSEEGGDDE